MKKGYQIYIPSYGRAGKVTTDSIIKKSKVVICEKEYPKYKKYHSNLFVIPDDRDGTITKKRNAILDLTEEKNIDDLKKIFYISTRAEG
jgi:hypothetical protein